MNKKRIISVVCVLIVIAILTTIIVGIKLMRDGKKINVSDGIEQIDLDTIYLTGSKVEVHFSDVILGNAKETRKLIVSEQESSVSIDITDKLIKQLDLEILKKSQKISYDATGYFVVDLDDLTPKSIVQDAEKKTVTIYIGHAHLQTVDIDPDKIIIDDVKQGLLRWGGIKLTVAEYNAIEKEIRNRIEEKFNTVDNANKADDTAIEMVKDVYEPVIKAIDSRYEVIVKFR